MPGYAHRGAWTLGAVLLFAAAAAGLAWHGARSRVFAPAPVTRLVASQAEASALWRGLGLRGRTLLWFDDYPMALLALDPGQPGTADPSDAMGHAIQHNVIRRAYLVLPEARWARFRERAALYLPLQPVPEAPAPVALHTLSGIPFVAVTPSSLPRLDEPVLVWVNGALYDLPQAAAALQARGLTADVVVALQGGGG